MFTGDEVSIRADGLPPNAHNKDYEQLSNPVKEYKTRRQQFWPVCVDCPGVGDKSEAKEFQYRDRL